MLFVARKSFRDMSGMKFMIMKSRQLHTALVVVFSSLIVCIVSCKTPPQKPPPQPPPPSSFTNQVIAVNVIQTQTSSPGTDRVTPLPSPKASDKPSPPSGSIPLANE